MDVKGSSWGTIDAIKKPVFLTVYVSHKVPKLPPRGLTLPLFVSVTSKLHVKLVF